jgi:Tol biopolymer transport system component
MFKDNRPFPIDVSFRHPSNSMKLRLLSIAFAWCTAHPAFSAESAADLLAPWRSNVRIQVASPEATDRHTIHSYFNTCPESPDGRSVLFFASKSADGHRGDVCVRDRATGQERVLAKDLYVEDAHRVACQQWLSNGKRVAFHSERDGVWCVTVVDLDTGKERILTKQQMAGWGQPNADLLPLYGPHWNPGDHRDLDILNVATGEKETVATVAALKAAYPEWYGKVVGENPASIFFPILSPDLKRVFFKMASATGADPRSKSASSRQGLVCYSIDQKRFLYSNARWGHPSWQPDSRHITEAGNLVYDSNDGAMQRVPGLPPCRGDHPTVSPDGKWRVTDTTLGRFGGKDTEWGIVVADARGNDHVIIHRFENGQGARSWRKSHPHPVFSPDGRRIYYNVSSGPWTKLHVAEIDSGASAVR